MERPPIRLLLVEGEQKGAFWKRIAATKDARVELCSVSELPEALELVAAGGIDALLLDLSVDRQAGLSTLERAATMASGVPIIALSDDHDEELAVSTLRAGAQDYLVKAGLDVTALSRAARYALERHRRLSVLRSLSLMDDLTGLFNRRGFSDLGSQYLELARRSDREATVVYLDLDRFKHINDQFGHQVGDQALRRVADILKASFRRSDIVARMGGDEFAVLALEGPEDDPADIVNRLRSELDRFNQTRREGYRLNASFGVARDAHRGAPLEELLAESDASMYAEKRKKLSRLSLRTP